jgi:hypothetical protein
MDQGSTVREQLARTTGGASSLFNLISMPHAIGRWGATNPQKPSFHMQGKQLENGQYILLMKYPIPATEWIGESNSEPLTVGCDASSLRHPSVLW